MYKVRILRRALKDLSSFPQGYARLIAEHIEQLQNDPRPPGVKKLRGVESYSLRVGVYRILYDVDDKTRSILIYRIKHRREVYR